MIKKELEDPPEVKLKLEKCSALISEFLKTLNESQIKNFYEIEYAISDYHASREDYIKSTYEKDI